MPSPVFAEGSSRVDTLELAPAMSRRPTMPSATFAALLFTLTVLNAIDAVMTLWAVRLGVATEANPIMAAALSVGEPVFFVAKMAVVGAGCAVLWAARRHRIAQIGAWLCVAVYLALAVVHIWTGAFIAEALSSVAA